MIPLSGNLLWLEQVQEMVWVTALEVPREEEQPGSVVGGSGMMGVSLALGLCPNWASGHHAMWHCFSLSVRNHL